jgi:hypothetical protein
MSKDSERSSAANAEYVYIIQDKNVWFIDYIIGIAFKTPVDFTTSNKTQNGTVSNTNGLLESGRPYREFTDIKDFQDYIEDRVGQEIEIESSVEVVTNIERDDRRIIWRLAYN